MSAGKTNGGERVGPRVELGRPVQDVPAKKTVEAILGAKDPQALIQKLPAVEAYHLIQRVGLGDAQEIVRLASDRQFQTFIDLAAWRKDQIDGIEVLKWFNAVRRSPDFLQKIRALDLELLEYLLRTWVVIHDLEEDPDVLPQGPVLETPEGRYLVEFKAEGTELQVLRSLVSGLIAEDPFGAVRFLEAVRWEVPTELSETAYQFRAARLQDLGFLPPEDASRLFSYLRPENRPRFSPPASSDTSKNLVAGGDQHFILLGITALSPKERENVEGEIRSIGNLVLMAEGADPGDVQATRRAAEMTRDYLSLGLEEIAQGDPGMAGEVIREVPLRTIFQTGYSLTLELKFRADRLARSSGSRLDNGSYRLFTEQARAVVALRRRRPLRAVKVEGAEPVTFRWRREVREAHQFLDRAEKQFLILSRLLSDEHVHSILEGANEMASEASVERMFATLTVNGLLEGKAVCRAVPSGRLDEFLQALFETGGTQIRLSAIERVHRAFSAEVSADLGDELRADVALTLERLAQEFGPAYIDRGTVDPRIASTLLVLSPGP